jgi:hypothetical protein
MYVYDDVYHIYRTPNFTHTLTPYFTLKSNDFPKLVQSHVHRIIIILPTCSSSKASTQQGRQMILLSNRQQYHNTDSFTVIMQIVTPYLYLVFTEGESHLTINTHRQEKEKGLGKTAVRKRYRKLARRKKIE